MDATSIFFVAVIVLLGGPLALFADWLGRRLGKRRHSLFGLRPRHTASMLTFLAGVLIPLIAVLAMLGLSKDVRQWLFDSKHILQERDRLLHQVGDETKALQDTQTKRTAAERGLSDAKRQYEQEERLAKNLSQQLRTLSAQLKVEKSRFAAQRQKVQILTAQVRSKTLSIAEINNELAQRKADLASAEAKVKAFDLSFKRLRKDYDTLDQERTKLIKQNESLNQQIGHLTPEVASLNAQKIELNKQLDQAKADRDQALRDRDGAIREKEKALSDLAQIENEASAIIGAYQNEPMIYRKDDELVRLPIEERLGSDDARRAVENLLSLARNQASAKGAEAAQGINVVGFSSGPNGMTPLEVQSSLIRGITRLRDPVVLIATTPVNVFKTQPVQLQVRVIPNPLVYRMAETIVSTRIDGTKSFDQIVEAVRSFLSDQVTLKAISDQMIPRQGQDSPLGEVTIRQITDVVQAIQAQGRSVKVSAVAKQDTRAADPLQIEFRVGR